MVSVKEIQTTSMFGNEFVYVEIILHPTHENLSEYQFDLYKSNDAISEFYPAQENLEEFFFEDYDVNLLNMSVQYFYKVKITSLEKEESLFSETFHYQHVEPDEYAFYLTYINKLYAEAAINNQKMDLLKRMKTGSLCPVCYDDVRKRTQLDCEVCYNTKYIEGYHSPKEVTAVYLNAPGLMEKFSPSNVAEEKTTIQIWTPNYPLIQVNDILVDKQSNRFIVINWQPSIKQFYLLRQTIQVQMLPRSSFLYNVPAE